MKRFIIIIIVCLSIPAFSQTTYNNFDDFKDACQSAQPGDEIILAAGRYDAESITIADVAGTAENPVIIRAEYIGADTLDDGTYMDLRHCSYVTIQGFVINITDKSTTFKIQTCNNIRITQNVLDGSGEPTDGSSSVWINLQSLWDDPTGLSHHNRIDHNLFQNKHTLGNMIRIDGTDDLYVSHHDVIEYNHFKNMGPRATNEMEAIRIGWSAMSESDGFCTVSNNLFEECNGDPEIISVKCNKNTISHNTFLRCEGTLSLRHGNESVIEGNFFLGEGAEGTGGVRIYGSDHIIINNYFEGLTGTKWDAPITLTYGDAEEGSGSLTNHFRIERALIANNTLVDNHHGIEVGYDNQSKYSKPPRDVVMANNLVTSDTGVFVTYINDPVTMTWDNNLFYTRDDATIADGVTFTGGEIIEADPLLVWDESLLQYRATAASPEYTHSGDIADNVQFDIDGQFRSADTQYGADEHQENPVLYTPLTLNDVGPDLGEYMQLSVLSMSAPMAGDTIEISVSSNLNWDVSSNAGWATIDPSAGSGSASFSLMIEKNESGVIRTASITVTSNNAEEGDEITSTIQISQAEKEPSILTLDKSVVSFTAVGANKSVAISSNIDWTVATEAEWLDIDPLSGSDNGTLTITVEENLSRASRNGTVTVSGDGLEEIIAVSQEGSAGSEVILTLIDAIASTEQVNNEAINVIDGDLSNRWSGEGDGAYIDLELIDSSLVSFIKVGLYKGDQRNSYFDIQTSKDGVEYFDAQTDITSEITEETLVIYDFHDTIATYVRIVGHGNSTSLWNSFTEFEVWGWSQAPPSLSLDKSAVTFTAATANESVEITSNVDWTVSSEETWLNINPSSGSGPGTLTISAEKNLSRSSRKGTVTVSAEEFEEVIAVSQSGSVGSEVMLTVVDAIASAEDGDNTADNVYDGLLTNRWTGEGDGATISLELSDSSIVSFIKVGLYKGDQRNSYFDIQTSKDGVEYFDAQTDITSEITEETLVIYDFHDTIATYVRIVGHGNSENDLNSYTEFEVWGWIIEDTGGTNEDLISAPVRGMVYPNPSNGSFTLIAEEGSLVQLHDLSGRVVKEYMIEEEQIQLNTGLPSGAYFLTIDDKDGRYSRKIIIR